MVRKMNKVKVLFVASDPFRQKPLDLAEEIREITTKIRASEYRDVLQLLPAFAARPDDLLQLLNEHRPQIVHFSSHGTKSEELVMQGEGGQPKAVSKQALKRLFRTMKGNIRLVLLNSCYSETQAEAITEEIDCTIGMNRAISDRAAIVLAGAFYRAIGFGESVQMAFEQAMTALMLEGIPEEDTAILKCGPGIDANQIVLVPLAFP